jgi:hypothetical protein
MSEDLGHLTDEDLGHLTDEELERIGGYCGGLSGSPPRRAHPRCCGGLRQDRRQAAPAPRGPGPGTPGAGEGGQSRVIADRARCGGSVRTSGVSGPAMLPASHYQGEGKR